MYRKSLKWLSAILSTAMILGSSTGLGSLSVVMAAEPDAEFTEDEALTEAIEESEVLDDFEPIDVTDDAAISDAADDVDDYVQDTENLDESQDEEEEISDEAQEADDSVLEESVDDVTASDDEIAEETAEEVEADEEWLQYIPHLTESDKNRTLVALRQDPDKNIGRLSDQLIEEFADMVGKDADSVTYGDISTIKTIKLSPLITDKNIGGVNVATNATEVDLSATSVTVLPSSAFAQMPELETVILPDGLKGLGDHTFADCEKLKVVTLKGKEKKPSQNMLPKGLQQLNGTVPINGERIFAGCTSLERMTIELTNSDALELALNMFDGCCKLSYVKFTNVSKVPNYCFLYAGVGDPKGDPQALLQVVFGTRIVTIGEGAFYGAGIKDGLIDLSSCSGFNSFSDSSFFASNVKTVYIPKNPEITINPMAFAESSLTTLGCLGTRTGYVDCANSHVSIIEDHAFAGCQGIKEFSGNENWQYIEEGTFSGCTSLATVDLSKCKKLQKIDKNAFSKLEVNFTNGRHIYEGCDLRSINIPSSVYYIGDQAFAGCPHLTTAKVNMSTDDMNFFLGVRVFENSTALKSIELSPSIKTIPDWFCMGCTALTAIPTGVNGTALANVETIGRQAFEKCTSLTGINFTTYKSLKTIGENAFYGCDNVRTIAFGAGSNVNTIGNGAFADCGDYPSKRGTYSAVSSIDFTNLKKLTYIGSSAFARAGIAELDLRNTQLTVLSNEAFRGCVALKHVYLNQGLKDVMTGALAGCPNLKGVDVFDETMLNIRTFMGSSGISEGTSVNGASISTDDSKNYTKINSGSFVLKVIPIDDTITVVEGSTGMFPYVVSPSLKATGSDFAISQVVVDGQSVSDKPYKYVKVKGTFSNISEDGIRIPKYYYKSVGKSVYSDLGGQKNTFSNYFEEQENLIVNGHNDRRMFQVEGLKSTGGGKVKFTISYPSEYYCGVNESGMYPLGPDIVYYVEVIQSKDVKYTPQLYTDYNRLQKVLSNQTFELKANAKNPSGSVNLYIDLLPMKKYVYSPDNYNVVVETSNPDIVVVNGGLVEGSKTKFVIPMPGGSNVSAATNGRVISLIPQGVGTAKLTLYAECSPTIKTTVNVDCTQNDIRDISLAVPVEFATSAQAGAKFNILNGVYTYLQKNVTRADNNIGDLRKVTSNTISFSSSNPSIASIDQQGNVTINKISTKGKLVKFTARTIGSEGDVLERELDYTVIYPKISQGARVAANNGSVMVITKMAKGSKQGTVTYAQAPYGASKVTVPSTLKLNGKTYKVTALDGNAFAGNAFVTSVTVGKYVTTIAGGAFRNCPKLKSISIKGKIKTIPGEMCSGCTALASFTVPKTVTTIEANAFNGDKKLKTFKFASGSKLAMIGDGAFNGCTALTKITIPKGVTTVGNNCFMDCKKLKTVTFAKSSKLTTIGANAFNGCKALKTLTITSTKLTTIGQDSLKGIYKKCKIKVPKSKLKEYKTLFKDKGQKKSVKITK